MALPAVVPGVLHGAERPRDRLCLQSAVPFVHQSHDSNPDNPDYRLYDLQSVAQKPNRRFRFALVPGNLCNMDTGGYRNQPDDICFLFLSTTPAICIGLGIAIADWLNYLKKRRLELGRTTAAQSHPTAPSGFICACTWRFLSSLIRQFRRLSRPGCRLSIFRSCR